MEILFKFVICIEPMKYLLTLLTSLLVAFVTSKVFAVQTYILDKTANVSAWHTTNVTGNRSILNTISMVNSYIWFFIGFFCFVFMIWNGYKLITANGDEKAMKSAKTALLWSFIWLAICILAYIIVNIAVNLFA
jgi:hypothetical protein